MLPSKRGVFAFGGVNWSQRVRYQEEGSRPRHDCQSHRHGPPLLPSICQPLTEMVSWSLPACHGPWTGLDGYQVSGESEKSIRAWRSRRHLETRSKLVVHVARAIRLTPLASSTANPHVAFAFFLLQPQRLVSECPSQRHGGGAVHYHYPFYHSC